MILDTIVERKKEELAELKKNGIHLPPEFQDKPVDAPRGFLKSLVDFDGVADPPEAKKASPSKGVISPDFDPVAIAVHYEKSGAQAVSVLTDVDFFQGHLRYLMQAREAINLPVIRKDFIIDEMQIDEARQHGADAILLIAAILDEFQLRDYHTYAKELGMDILVEVHDEEEVEKAMKADSLLIGVNNRNLKDFTMDINTTFRLKKIIPDTIPVVSESGLKNRDDMERLASEGIAAALIGESLMRAGSSGNLLRELR